MARSSRRWLTLDRVRGDLQYACRGLRQSPAFAATAILSLALGIGASTAVATQVNAVFFQTLPVSDPPAIRSLAWTSPQRAFAEGLFRGPTWDARTIGSFPHAVFEQIRDRVSAFSGVACWRSATESLDAGGLVRVQAVSGSYFRTLGVSARSGRTLLEEDDRAAAPLVAVAKDPSLLNQTIRIHGHVFNVVGVLPEDFSGLSPMEPPDIFVTYAADALFPTFQRNAWSQCHIVVRIRPGSSIEQARAETEVVVQQLIAASPPKEPYQLPQLHLEDLSMQSAELQRSTATPLRLVGATVGILLLITCANIAGLLFARGRARRKELATRLALGGARGRLVQQLLTESLVLSAAGGAVGIGFAFALTPVLPRILQELAGTTALGVNLRPDPLVLSLAVAVTAVCGVLFGLVPALAVVRIDPMAALRQATGIAPPARLRAGKVALALQLTLAMAVLGAAGLLVRTMINLGAVPLGYEPEGMAFVETNNPVGRPRAFVEQTLAELQKMPGVTQATVSQWPIFNNTVLRAQFCIPGADPQQQRLDLSLFSQGFSKRGVFALWRVATSTTALSRARLSTKRSSSAFSPGEPRSATSSARAATALDERSCRSSASWRITSTDSVWSSSRLSTCATLGRAHFIRRLTPSGPTGTREPCYRRSGGSSPNEASRPTATSRRASRTATASPGASDSSPGCSCSLQSPGFSSPPLASTACWPTR